MSKILNDAEKEQYELIYKRLKAWHDDEFSATQNVVADDIKEISSDLGKDRRKSTARFFKKIVEGKKFTHPPKENFISYCLDRMLIDTDYGKEHLITKALPSLYSYIEHYEDEQRKNNDNYRPEIKKIYDDFREELGFDRIFNSTSPYDRKENKTIIDERFLWIPYFEIIATELLNYSDKRGELLEKIFEISQKFEASNLETSSHVKMPNFMDKYEDGSEDKLNDICPFTTMTCFCSGRNNSDKIIAEFITSFSIEISSPLPKSFEGVPFANFQNSWLFGYAKYRKPDDIDVLWEVFLKGIKFADDSNNTDSFVKAFDSALDVKRTAMANLTMGLYWARPYKFLPLDGPSRAYLQHLEDGYDFRIPDECKNRKGEITKCTGENYINIMEQLKILFEQDFFPASSFPELSYNAFHFDSKDMNAKASEDNIIGRLEKDEYDADNLIEKFIGEDCFINHPELKRMYDRLKEKKNLILQGPPGTGKTWLAKRLGYVVMKEKAKDRIVSVQFHPNMSYEDFVMGYRPNESDDPEDSRTLKRANGIFVETIEKAIDDENNDYVIVIEEINRGNPAQIFGELLTLLEEDKRKPEEALRLCYHNNGEEIYIPENLYVIGTMNLADRSLAIVDFALRRRFAFEDLQPAFNGKWLNFVSGEEIGMDRDFMDKVKDKMNHLNDKIKKDPELGEQFCIGHSFFTPSSKPNNSPAKWYREIVRTEIVPLLKEYWLDAPIETSENDESKDTKTKVEEAEEELLEGMPNE